jgi:hypothetical protein
MFCVLFFFLKKKKRKEMTTDVVLTLDKSYTDSVDVFKLTGHYFYSLYFAKSLIREKNPRTGGMSFSGWSDINSEEQRVARLELIDCFLNLDTFNLVSETIRDELYKSQHEFNDGTVCKLSTTQVVTGNMLVNIRNVFVIVRSSSLHNEYMSEFLDFDDPYDDRDQWTPEHVEHEVLLPPFNQGIYYKRRKIPFTYYDRNLPAIRYTLAGAREMMNNIARTKGLIKTEFRKNTTYPSEAEAKAVLDFMEQEFIRLKHFASFVFECPQYNLYAVFEKIYLKKSKRYRYHE